MKKYISIMVMLFVSVVYVVGADYVFTSLTPSVSTTTYNIPDNSIVKNVKLINGTTAYCMFQVKISSSIYDYVLVSPKNSETIVINKIVRAFNTAISTNQPPVDGFNGGVSSGSAIGTIINYSR